VERAAARVDRRGARGDEAHAGHLHGALLLDGVRLGTTAFADHPLWLAPEEREASARDGGFGGWSRWTFLQALENVRFGKAVVDVDVFRGTREDLSALAGPR
jgi:hypothetical protein